MVALVANTIFGFAAYAWISTTTPIVVNVVLLAVAALIRVGTNSYTGTAEKSVARVAERVDPFASLNAQVAGLLAAAQDGEVKVALKGLKEDMSFSPSVTQPHVMEVESQFAAEIDAIAASLDGGDAANETLALVKQARAIWRKRNALVSSVK